MNKVIKNEIKKKRAGVPCTSRFCALLALLWPSFVCPVAFAVRLRRLGVVSRGGRASWSCVVVVGVVVS